MPFANEFADEPRVADGFALALDVEACVEPVVDEAVALAARDGFANLLVFKPLAFEALPELRLGEPLPRQHIAARSYRIRHR